MFAKFDRITKQDGTNTYTDAPRYAIYKFSHNAEWGQRADGRTSTLVYRGPDPTKKDTYLYGLIR